MQINNKYIIYAHLDVHKHQLVQTTYQLQKYSMSDKMLLIVPPLWEHGLQEKQYICITYVAKAVRGRGSPYIFTCIPTYTLNHGSYITPTGTFITLKTLLRELQHSQLSSVDLHKASLASQPGTKHAVDSTAIISFLKFKHLRTRNN